MQGSELEPFSINTKTKQEFPLRPLLFDMGGLLFDMEELAIRKEKGVKRTKIGKRR